MNVDELIAQVTPHQVAAFFGVPFPADAAGEVRIPSVFAERGKGENSYGALTINLDQPQNPIYCHVTGTRGNLLTLIHGFKHHRPPVSGKLRGDEFKEAARILQEIAGKVDAVLSGQTIPASASPAPVASAPAVLEPQTSEPVRRNIPLKDSENERARTLVTLHEQTVVDVAEMSPATESTTQSSRLTCSTHSVQGRIEIEPPRVFGASQRRRSDFFPPVSMKGLQLRPQEEPYDAVDSRYFFVPSSESAGQTSISLTSRESKNASENASS